MPMNIDNVGVTPNMKMVLRAEATKPVNKKSIDAMLADLEGTVFPEFKKYIGAISRAEEMRAVVTLYRLFGGDSPAVRRQMMTLIFKARGLGAAKLVEDLATPTSKAGVFFNKFAGKANGLALIITVIEVLIHLKRGDVGPAFAEAFKFGASKVLPWAAVLEGVQSLIDAFVPNRQTSSTFSGVLRMIDPVGVGAVGVDGVVTFAQAAYDAYNNGGWTSDQVYDRLSRVTDRMNAGSTGWLAAKAYRAGNMTKQEWLAVLKRGNANAAPMGLMP